MTVSLSICHTFNLSVKLRSTTKSHCWNINHLLGFNEILGMNIFSFGDAFVTIVILDADICFCRQTHMTG